jgi:hypothetical protein
MVATSHDFWLGFRFALSVSAVFLIVYLRFWFGERVRAGSWRKGHQNLWKKPKRWQLILFCVLWGSILAAFILAATVYHR